MRTVHVPVRECISCGKKRPKHEFLRIVKGKDGVFYDASAKADGRGAYVCPDEACLERLVQQKRLNRAFRGAVDASVYEAVTQAAALALSGQQKQQG